MQADLLVNCETAPRLLLTLPALAAGSNFSGRPEPQLSPPVAPGIERGKVETLHDQLH
jgi:hypothetical protein